MSEFYAQRRTSIKDGTGLMFFIIGWFAAAPFAWPFISAGFDDGGSPASGVLKFLFVVFPAGAIGGLLGLGIGSGVGSLWERWHRNTRPASDYADDAPAATTALPHAPSALAAYARFESGLRDFEKYQSLTNAPLVSERDRELFVAALRGGIIESAWKDDELIGVCRVVTDGVMFAAVAELMVHADHRRSGIGRELLNRCYDRTPRGMMHIVAPASATEFLAHAGCERSAGGFVMRRPSRRL